jgi:hypothetical protein
MALVNKLIATLTQGRILDVRRSNLRMHPPAWPASHFRNEMLIRVAPARLAMRIRAAARNADNSNA